MKVSFLGGGNMATAMISGMLKQKFSAQLIQVAEHQESARIRLEQDLSVRTYASVNDEFLNCEVLVLAVKPQQMQQALMPLVGKLSYQIILSIAAGLSSKNISLWLGGYRKIVRAMPNTPALIGEGMTGLFAATQVTAVGHKAIEKIVGSTGKYVWVKDEAMMDVITAISGSGPAYVFYFIEALQAAGEAQGLSQEMARLLALQTVQGAVQLAIQSGDDPAALRIRVTSKGGTTEAALKSLEKADFPGIIRRAAKAAIARGQEMNEEATSSHCIT